MSKRIPYHNLWVQDTREGRRMGQCVEGVTLRVFDVREKRVLHTSCWAEEFADAVLTHDSLSFIFFLHSRWFPKNVQGVRTGTGTGPGPLDSQLSLLHLSETRCSVHVLFLLDIFPLDALTLWALRLLVCGSEACGTVLLSSPTTPLRGGASVCVAY